MDTALASDDCQRPGRNTMMFCMQTIDVPPVNCSADGDVACSGWPLLVDHTFSHSRQRYERWTLEFASQLHRPTWHYEGGTLSLQHSTLHPHSTIAHHAAATQLRSTK